MNNHFNLLHISRQARAEMEPLFNVQHAVFQLCTKVCAYKFMDEVAGFRGLGATTATLEAIHIDSANPSRCGTHTLMEMQEVMDGFSQPTFTFQVTFA